MSEDLTEYESKFPLTRNLFWNRLKIASNLVQITDDSVMLDIGCNKGYLLKVIRESNDTCICHGIDIEKKIDPDDLRCHFTIGDAKNLPYPSSYFDVVFALDTLEHIPEVDLAIKEIHRVLKLNGIFILSGPTETWFYKFCRFLQHGQFKKPVHCDDKGNLRESDNHFYDIYTLEKKFSIMGFKQVEQRSLPNFPLPQLFRITKFSKLN